MNIVWRMIAYLSFLIGLVFVSPIAVGLCDMFYWFWTNYTWSGIEYGNSSRPLVMMFFCVPAAGFTMLGSIIIDALREHEKMESIQKKIEENRNE